MSVAAMAEKIVAAASSPDDAAETVNILTEEMQWFASVRKSSAFNLDIRAPHFLPKKDKDGKTLKDNAGNVIISSERATANAVRSRMSTTFRSMSGADIRRDGSYDAASGTPFALTIGTARGFVTRTVRLVSFSVSADKKAEHGALVVSVKQADGTYAVIGLHVGNVVAMSGSK